MNAKSLLAGLLLAVTVTVAWAQSKDGLARVEKLQGIETYVMCEPLREYETVFEITTGAKASSFLSGGVVNEGVSDKASQFVNRAVKEARKENREFDAVLISGSKKATAIKFKAPATDATKGIARVRKINGYEIYVMNEPLRDYQTSVNATGGIKAKSYFTSGLVNNSIEEDIAQFVKRVQKEADDEKKKFEAVVYSSGKNAIGVTFK